MSEKELNSYRFLSGDEPTDEMLECIMKDALESAMKRRREVEKKINAEMERQRAFLKKKWSARMNSVNNG